MTIESSWIYRLIAWWITKSWKSNNKSRNFSISHISHHFSHWCISPIIMCIYIYPIIWYIYKYIYIQIKNKYCYDIWYSDKNLLQGFIPGDFALATSTSVDPTGAFTDIRLRGRCVTYRIRLGISMGFLWFYGIWYGFYGVRI